MNDIMEIDRNPTKLYGKVWGRTGRLICMGASLGRTRVILVFTNRPHRYASLRTNRAFIRRWEEKQFRDRAVTG